MSSAESIKEPPKKKQSEKKKTVTFTNNKHSRISAISSQIKVGESSYENSSVTNKDLSKINPKKNVLNIKTKKNKKISQIIERKNFIKSHPLPKLEKLSPEDEKVNSILNKNRNLNIYELNILDYQEAIILDKRTYCQYYICLLKQKQLILFTFLPQNDYNLKTMKIAYFILSLSLYFTVNAFFFTDETMNKITVDNGKYNFIAQLPLTIYSSVITTIINMLVKNLALSEKSILAVKTEKNKSLANKISKKNSHCIKIKFSIFCCLGILLMIFFWYFISCFCAVYKNTQKIFIGNTLISFVVSMSYPFGIELLPGFFRIPALKTKENNKSCLFRFSKFIALF